MKPRKIIIILLLTWNFSLAQNQTEREIFMTVINNEMTENTGIRKSGFEIYCEKNKSSFELNEFLASTGLDIPTETLMELEEYAKNGQDGIWESKLFTEIKLQKNSKKSRKCITEKNTQKMYKRKKTRQTILKINRPIFDLKKEYCEVSLVLNEFTGSASGYTLFLKKVEGKWIVISEYGIWMT